jgi:ABC-type nitrate/sulfonate/bicarbonate transport system permease component
VKQELDDTLLTGRAQSADVDAVNISEGVRGNKRRVILGAGFLLLMGVAWAGFSRLGWINPVFFSSPSRFITTLFMLITNTGPWEPGFWASRFWQHFASSGGALLYGWMLAMAIGIPLGVAMGWYEPVRDTLDYFLAALYATPRIAIIPVLVLLLGYGPLYKTIVVFIMTLFPILLNTTSGIRNVDNSLVRMARAFGARDLKIFVAVALPSAVPFVVAGLRQAVAFGLVGVTVGELFASNRGLGYMIVRAAETYQTDILYAVVFLLAVLGILLNGVLLKFEARFQQWHPRH